MTENLQAEGGDAQAQKQRSLPRRMGCWALVIAWFLLMLLPCFCIALAINQEIVIPTGSVPGQHIRIWLIMEEDGRGVGISSASLVNSSENAVCVQTQTRFVLWAGRAEPVQSCECYQRASTADAWSLVSIEAAQCGIADQE